MHHFPRRPHTAPASTAAAPTRYSDRFIPHRTGSDDLRSAYELLRPPTLDENLPALSNTPTPPSSYSLLLKSELLDTPPSLHPVPSALPAASPPADARLPKRPHPRNNPRSPALDSLKRASAPPNSYPPPPNIFRFSAPPRPHSHPTSTVATPISQPPTPPSPFCLADSHSRRALLSARLAPGRAARKIARVPFKVLDAPALKDDFYFNLVDWSSQNVLALCDLHLGGPVCSVAWNQMGTQLAVGTMPGDVQVYDTATGKLLRSMPGHTARAGALAWSAGVLSSGSRDKTIFNRDLRSREPYIAQLTGHRQEVCGLKWSSDDMQLASGGNDNNLMIWNAAGLGSGGGTRRLTRGVRFATWHGRKMSTSWSPPMDIVRTKSLCGSTRR
ncbi:WD40-repeat containing protein [Chondrus crispus]|uniref:WD40-repeat containing protein n=1 Tax=Chondrus crispus TaxID=2769 RepID=R7QQF7_CHOCR|nr:WD40-repeat containing protein [Chondrus crispus]CDF39721.1 WD40-repeat containing protein [Chondrus crispus]|eukprot:XP_005710015.1 WD40-repeat containing protein [Chondrus crispus]